MEAFIFRYHEVEVVIILHVDSDVKILTPLIGGFLFISNNFVSLLYGKEGEHTKQESEIRI